MTTRKQARDHERIMRYVRLYNERHPDAAWEPTVRQVAKSVRMRQEDIEQECQELPLMLTGYNVENEVLGNLVVEICE